MDESLNMKDLKATMLIGTEKEMTDLLNVIDKQKISILEKKIFRTLLQFKLKKYEESNESMDELIKDIGNLDLPNQAKMHMFRAEIFDKLLQSPEIPDKLKWQEGAIKALRKAIRIFRDLSNENYPYFGEHHFYLQIGDQFNKYEIYQDALESYQYIFEAKEKYFVYPNDWAIRILSYFRYFEITQLKFKQLVKQQILDNCQREIIKQERQQVDEFKLDFYNGVNYLLDDKIDMALKCFENSESNYYKKNEMKRNNKLIDYVNKFIKIKEPFNRDKTLSPDIEPIIDPIIDPNVYAIGFVPNFLEMQKGYHEIVNKRLEILNQKEKQRSEWLDKISKLEQQINQPQQDIQNGELKEVPNEQQIEAKRKQIQIELDIEKENFKKEFSEDFFDVHNYFQEFKYQPGYNLLDSMGNQLGTIQKIVINEKANAQNIYQYCCFEFLQIEKYDYARLFLQDLEDKGFAIVFILIMFISEKIEDGLEILRMQTSNVLKFDLQLEQGFNLFEHKYEFYVKILSLMANYLSQQQDFDEDTFKLNNELSIYLRNYCKEEYYKYLFEEIENCRFYDPYVYEFKDKLFTYLFNRKKGNMQAIFSNGRTYVEILKDTKDSWSVNKEKKSEQK